MMKNNQMLASIGGSKASLDKISKFDKLYILSESLSIIKEKEILRIIHNGGGVKGVPYNKERLEKTLKMLATYFGKSTAKKIHQTFKTLF